MLATLPDRFEFLSDAWIDEARNFLTRNAVRTADFFQIPPSRVVELGAQVAF